MRRVKRSLCILLILCMLVGLMPVAAFAANDNMPFTDVKESDWFYESVKYVYDNQLMLGTGETTFSPGATITRGMIVTILHRMEGKPTATAAGFPDVAAGRYCTEAVLWASANGIVKGYENGNFGPDDAITREQLAAILYRYMQYKGYDVSADGAISGFADASEVSAYAVEALNWAVGAGVVKGTKDNKLAPKGNATRAEAATMLMRFCENVVPETYTVTFNYNYDGKTAVVSVLEGKTVEEPAAPERADFTFGGWYTDADGKTAYDFGKAVTENVTLYAKWTANEPVVTPEPSVEPSPEPSVEPTPEVPKSYTVSFDYNYDEKGTYKEAKVEEGTAVGKPDDPSRSNYVFLGWTTDKLGLNSFDFSTPVTSDMTLYAQWKANSSSTTVPTVKRYTVTFESNGGSEVESQTVRRGYPAVAPEAPTKDNYIFTGWYTDSELTTLYDFSSAVRRDITLYAKWEEASSPAPEYYTVTFNSNGGSDVAEQTVASGALASYPEDPEKNGYRFVAWYSDEGLTTVYEFDAPVTADITLYASWEEIVEEKDSFLDQDPPDVEIYDFDSDCRSIVVGESILVTFAARIFAETALDSDEVKLYQGDSILGTMHDDGADGDEIAGDGIFTYQDYLSSSEECILYYQVKVRTEASEARSIGFYIPMTDEELDGMETVDNALAELVNGETFSELSTAEKGTQVVALLNQLADIDLVVADSIFYDETDKIVYYEYATGALGMVMLEQNSDVNSNGNGKTGNTEGSEINNIAAVQTNALNNSNSGNERNVLILNGFEVDPTIKRREYYYELKNEWDAIGLNTTIDVDVTVADMKKLANSNWDIIVFAMHGDKIRTNIFSSEKVPVLCLNEVANRSTDKAYNYELTKSKTVRKSGKSYYIVPEFFTDNYSSKAFDGMAFYSETCKFFGSGSNYTSPEPDYTMSNAIVGRSAEVVVGYHNSVDAYYSRDVMKIVIEESFNGKTISEALAKAKEEKGAKDRLGAYPVIAGSDSFIIRPDGLVRGKVKDADTNFAIGNAFIRAYNEDGKKVETTISDYAGSYSLNLSVGTYFLVISAASHKNGKALVVVNSGEITYVETFLLVGNTQNIGSINGHVINSVTDTYVADVTIKLRKNWDNKTGTVIATTTTDSNGYYELGGLSTGLYTMEYYKSGYVTGYKNIYVSIENYDIAVISPIASNGIYRIVLTWGENPRDLDSHVEGSLSDSSSFHVYYMSKSQYDGDTEICNLDVDDTTSYGPETITLVPNTDTPYYYYIYRYAGSGSISTSGAQIKLYSGNTLIATYNAPIDQGTSDYWNVFAIVDGEIVVRNTITSSADISYANT